ncbi:MAG: adenylate kinase [Thermonema sp.]|jgi:adenylate kinase|uniref:adenylate kinase n=1 Tax=Thermonema TaxID=28194 RepID=UPI000570D7F5|nr:MULTISPECIES: adenylate kinase [Thermonema]GIV39913.1 MAG: adenylate kinase [Thermonema sp.]
MINLVLFGPPGAGKGTQSKKLIEKYDLVHISTGDLFRKHLSEGTPLGQLAQKYMDQGELVPDQVVIDMVADKIRAHQGAKGFIFDGFPRTVSQAEALDEMLKEFNTSVSVMIALEVPEEELKKRLKKRAELEGRVDDQDEAKINNRIRVYLEETLPVADYYEKQGKLRKIDGVGEIEEIFAKICEAVEEALVRS